MSDTQPTQTRAELIERLAVTETNKAIAKAEMEATHRKYILTCDLREDGIVVHEFVDVDWARFEEAEQAYNLALTVFDETKAQLLALS